MQKPDRFDIAVDQANVSDLPVDRVVERLREVVVLARALLRRTLLARQSKARQTAKHRHVEDSLATLAGLYVGAYENISDRQRRLMDRLE